MQVAALAGYFPHLAHLVARPTPGYQAPRFSELAPAPPALVDLEGRTFGQLRVIGEARTGQRDREWPCLCACGGARWASTYALISWRVRSCGCLLRAPRTGRAGVP